MDARRENEKLKTQHRKAHHMLDAMGAPVVRGDKPLTLSERISALAKKLSVYNEAVARAEGQAATFQEKAVRIALGKQRGKEHNERRNAEASRSSSGA